MMQQNNTTGKRIQKTENLLWINEADSAHSEVIEFIRGWREKLLWLNILPEMKPDELFYH